jgi:hypothetical protein
MLIGFLSSVAPEFIKKWQDSADKKHELAVMELQMQQQRAGYAAKLEEVSVAAYSDIVSSAHKEQAESLEKASRWVADLSASVRPVITYLFVIAFIGFKMALLASALNPSLPWAQAMTFKEAFLLVWGAEESAGFWGIMAYWFGDRTMAKRR